MVVSSGQSKFCYISNEIHLVEISKEFKFVSSHSIQIKSIRAHCYQLCIKEVASTESNSLELFRGSSWSFVLIGIKSCPLEWIVVRFLTIEVPSIQSNSFESFQMRVHVLYPSYSNLIKLVLSELLAVLINRSLLYLIQFARVISNEFRFNCSHSNQVN